MKKAIILERFKQHNYVRTFFRVIIKIIDDDEKESTMYFIDFNRTPDNGPEGMSIEITDYKKDNPNQFTHTAGWNEDGWIYFGKDDTEEEFEKCLQDFVKYHGAEFVTDKPKANRITEIEEDLDILD